LRAFTSARRNEARSLTASRKKGISSAMIVRVIAALCAVSFTVSPAAAQSRLSDPLQAAQHSWMCRSVVPSADVIFDTDPWRRQPPAPADYMKWSNALASQAAWSVLHGYSLWTIDREHRNAVLAALNEAPLVRACRAEMGVLPGAAQEAVRADYAPRWQAVREANLARQNVPTTDAALMRKEAEWCVAAFDFGNAALLADPQGTFGIDTRAPGGRERSERFGRAFAEQLDWWVARARMLRARPEAAAPRTEQMPLMREVHTMFEYAGLGPADLSTVRGHFIRQETNFCAAKANALRRGGAQ
jgi:hypothetical protein